MAELKMLNQALDITGGIDNQAPLFLTLQLGDERYAIELLRVQEIKGWQPVTPLPKSPPHICGVAKHRGEIIPVVDLRLLLGMPFKAYSKKTVVVVINIKDEGETKIVGVVVDDVAEVYNIALDEIKEIPDFGSAICTDYIQGMTDIADETLVLLDADKLLSREQLT